MLSEGRLMAKTVDLQLQKTILELRQKGKGIREISRELKVSPSRVSRALQPAATNELFRALPSASMFWKRS